ncbi:MAG: Zn-ribbon domain-containing OB-fold protein [Candidatus Heimdallarchaeota archaeon]|nr:Zn-ribbon domain-containing OB-fold protein [Candidatus Heimdallarchaeota archaeon]
MLPSKRDAHKFPTTSVYGDFPVTYHYTVGIAGDKFFSGLKDKKLVANTCPSCKQTFIQPKIYCEDCFDELGEDTYKEVAETGEVFSFSEVFLDFRGNKINEPYFLGLIKIDGTNTTFMHKLLDAPEIGMKVKAVWNDERTGSILDLKGFSKI